MTCFYHGPKTFVSFLFLTDFYLPTNHLLRHAIWQYQHYQQLKDTIFVLLLSSLIRISLGILLVNITLFLWPFDDREAEKEEAEYSLNNLVPRTTGGRERYVCLSGYFLMTTEGPLFPVFWERSIFLFLCMTFSSNCNVSIFRIFSNSNLIFSEVGSNNW